MVHRCKKCSDILKVASVGRGEHANLKACHFSHFQFQLCHRRSLQKCLYTFYIYGPLVNKSTFSFLKNCVLAILLCRYCPSHVLQDIWGDNSIKRACLKNLNVFDQWSIDIKSAVTFLKWPLVAELKFKTWNMTGPQIGTFTSANRCYFKNVTAIFTSMEHWAKRPFVRFWKDGLLAELKARMCWGCRFLLFLKQRCLVTLIDYSAILKFLSWYQYG